MTATMPTATEHRTAKAIASSNLPVDFLVRHARSAIKSNPTGRTWRMLPADVERLVEAHGVADARFYAAEIIVRHRGWGLAELTRSAAARGIEY